MDGEVKENDGLPDVVSIAPTGCWFEGASCEPSYYSQRVIDAKDAELEVVKAERDAYKNRVNVAVGWMYSEACARMDNGDDIRKAELPEIADRLKSALEHAYPIPTGDKESDG